MEEDTFIIMGAGAWGTAVAIHLSSLGLPVILVPRDEAKAKTMREKRENIYHLPHIALPENLTINANLDQVFASRSVVFLACPTQGLKSVCERLCPFEGRIRHIISLVKGLDQATLQPPSQVIAASLKTVDVACLSGPTYAYEFAQGKPAAMVLASPQDSMRELQHRISSANVRIYRTRDLRGVELASCLKNIYAIGAGILDGLQLGDNAKAAYLTRALNEMTRLGVHFGGKKETFYGLSGLGDLMATAQGVWSRNRSFGFAFAQGTPISQLLREKTVEGYWSIHCFYQLTKDTPLDLPILQSLFQILYENHPLSQAVSGILSRKLKEE